MNDDKIRLRFVQDEINPNTLNFVWDYTNEEQEIIYNEIIPILELDELIQKNLGITMNQQNIAILEGVILGRIKNIENRSGITFNEYIKRRLEGFDIKLKKGKDIICSSYPY